jgi:hypothetical protein
MNSAGPFLLVLAIFAVSITLQMKGNAKARSLIEEWAQQNTYQLLSTNWSFFGGKFWFGRSKSQRVYRVSVRDIAGQTREADVKCGSYFGGMLSEDLDVRWRD